MSQTTLDVLRARHLIQESSSLDSLGTKLCAEGVTFPNRKALTKGVKKLWKKSCPPVPSIDDLVTEPISFPTTEVVNGRTYLLHGIVHGQPPFANLSQQVTQFVNKHAQSYRQQPGENYLFEQHFDEHFELNPLQSMDDMKHAIRQMSFQESMAMLRQAITILFLTPLVLTQRLIPHSRYNLARLAHSALQDQNYWPHFFQYMDSARLPLPLRWEVNEELSPLETFNHRRSQIMAEGLRSYAETRKIERMHGIVGFGHVDEIAYFLQHQ